MSIGVRFFLLMGALVPSCLLAQQTTICQTSAVPPLIRVEGLTERIGDIVYHCTGTPNAVVTGNFTVALNTNISNRISAGNTLTGIIFTVDSGLGPQATTVSPLLLSTNTLVFNGVAIPMSPQGTVVLRIADIRADATRVPIGANVIASLAVNVANIPVTSSQLIVATPQKSLYVGFSTNLVCAQNGSPWPVVLNFTNLIRARTAFASVRFTEGFADAFTPFSAPASLNADNDQRIILRYSRFPADAHLFVPNVVAGSDALRPTAGGDFGVPTSGGAYAPGVDGTLLLSLVNGADSNGAGGTPIYTPGPAGSGAVAFDDVSELTITGGAAYAVYEVMDANPFRIETAQFPTFLGLFPDGNRSATVTDEHIYLAAVSTTGTASTTAPIPRFIAREPEPDCSLVGDCQTYLPQLVVDATSLDFSAQAGSGAQQNLIYIRNTGGGAMHWVATVAYANGSGWLTLLPPDGINNASLRIFALPQNLTAGTYRATIKIDGGLYTSPKTVPVTFVVTPAPVPAPVPVPTVDSVVNAASFAAVPAVPGSLTTVMGSAFTGKIIAATFNGQPGTILFSNDRQINLLVPPGLTLDTPAQLVITVDGVASKPRAVPLASFAPAVFSRVVFNQDTTVNSVTNPAAPNSVVVVFATGLSGVGTITARIQDRDIDIPYYAGPAPGFPGVQQVNLTIPEGLSGLTTDLFVCGTAAGGSKVCSTAVPLTIR